MKIYQLNSKLKQDQVVIICRMNHSSNNQSTLIPNGWWKTYYIGSIVGFRSL